MVYFELSDLELVQLLKNGDEKAFAEIFLRYNMLLLNFAYKKINDRQAAEDIIQDIFTQFWNQRLHFELKASLSSYLFTVVLNTIRNIYKHQQIKDKHIDYLQHLLSEIDEEAMADFLVREKDFQQLIDKEIAALPEKCRQVFLLRKKAFLTNKQIAEKMGISEQTVETHIKTAFKRLRSRLRPAAYLFLPFF